MSVDKLVHSNFILLWYFQPVCNSRCCFASIKINQSGHIVVYQNQGAYASNFLFNIKFDIPFIYFFLIITLQNA